MRGAFLTPSGPALDLLGGDLGVAMVRRTDSWGGSVPEPDSRLQLLLRHLDHVAVVYASVTHQVAKVNRRPRGTIATLSGKADSFFHPLSN